MVIKLLLLILLAVLLVYSVGCSLQRRLLFPRHMIWPPGDVPGPPPGVEAIWIDSPRGPVEAWFMPGDAVCAESPGPAVIFAHGNAELIDHYADDFQPYRRLGVSVLLVEFRGYGRSAGSPSQRAITEDFVRFHGVLAARPDVDTNRLVYHGRSVGGGAVCALASTRPPAAMILQSAFTSVADIARRLLVPRVLVLDPFDNRKVVSQLDCPTLILHGRQDRIIDFAHAEALHAAAPRSTLIGYDCGHNDEPPQDLYWHAIEQFLRDSGVLASR
ncbi:MAG: alpha/beta hydrolase [Phycisphaeraceae bacterium]